MSYDPMLNAERSLVARLRKHYAAAPKNEVRRQAVAFLADYTGRGERVGDLLGPGWSARAMAEQGLRVLSAEDTDWPTRILGSRELAVRAAIRMAADEGFDVHIGRFSQIVGQVATAYYDSCGPYLLPTSRDVRAMAQAGLRAFVVTCLLARVEGMKGKNEGHYLRMARVGFEEDAPGYLIDKELHYRGELNVPMAAFFLVRRMSGMSFGPPVRPVVDEAA